MKHVDSVAAAQQLATELNSAERTTPIAVVSTPAGSHTSLIDAGALHDAVGDLVPVYVMATGPVSRAFSEQMPDLTQVYGGAGRVYPVGAEWVHDPRTSPLRLAFNAHEGQRSTEALINDALSMASAAGLVGHTVATTAEVVTGQVVGVTAERGIVECGSGQYANIVAELTVPGVPVERIVTSRMAVSGTLDDARRLDMRAMVRPPSALPYVVGDVVLARVDAVEAASAQLAVHPQLVVDVPREAVTSNPLDHLDSLMSSGEVLRARVASTSPWALVLSDVEDDEEALPAFALVDGGPPWLVEGIPDVEPAEEPERPAPTPRPEERGTTSAAPREQERVESASPPTPPTPAIFDRGRKATPAAPASAHEATPGPASEPRKPGPRPTAPPAPATIARLQAELAEVTDELRHTQAEVEDLRSEHRLLLQERTKATNRANHIQRELAGAKRKLREARRQPAGDQDGGARFHDPEEQFRHDVYVAWANRMTPDDKARRPRREYVLGPRFLESVAALDIARGKILDVVVEVLTGIANEQTSRQVHALRTADGGDSSQRVRQDGATAWRVNLQVKTANARRLHYWRLADGRIELSRVVLHDDYAP